MKDFSKKEKEVKQLLKDKQRGRGRDRDANNGTDDHRNRPQSANPRMEGKKNKGSKET
jgi:hypothetical protein